MLVWVKWNLSVISKNPLYKEGNAWFTTVPFKTFDCSSSREIVLLTYPSNQRVSKGHCLDIKRTPFYVLTTFLSILKWLHFGHWNDQTFDVKMTKRLTLKWPNFWCWNKQTFDVKITKLLMFNWPNFWCWLVLTI